jgi:hypothetical protein
MFSWIRKISWKIRKTGRFLKRLLGWIPVLWNDEDWEYNNIFEIMAYKISRVRKNIQKNNFVVDTPIIVKQMKIVEELLLRHTDKKFYYYDNTERSHIKKESCDCETLNKNEWQREICKYCISRYKIDQQKEEDDIHYAYEMLKKHSLTWWD